MSSWIIIIGFISLMAAGLILARAAHHADQYERTCRQPRRGREQ